MMGRFLDSNKRDRESKLHDKESKFGLTSIEINGDEVTCGIVYEKFWQRSLCFRVN